jgi:hypothetical protein
VRQELLLKAVQLLEKQEAVGLAPAQVRTFLGTEPEDTNEQPFLLRGFASDNSAARVFVSGKNVSVSSEGLGGLANIRRYPCVAYLGVQPDKVYTMATYDL